VVGSGPNGLAAAVLCAEEGLSVTVLEARERIGGGARTAELTLPGYHHDVCSAVYPMALASPFFRRLPLEQHGLEWIHPPLPLAHPLDDGSAAVLHRSVAETAATLGQDGPAYRKLFEPLVSHWSPLFQELLGPVRLPRHPLLVSRFGYYGIQPAGRLVNRHFETAPARALFAGIAGHSMLPFDQPISAAVGCILTIAGHAVGWPIPRGGAAMITEALARYLRSLGGAIETSREIHSLDDLPDARTVLLDVAPRQLLAIAGDRFTPRYRRALKRYRHGPGTFKIDWALDGPVPWSAPACRRAGTVHVGGPFEELAQAEREVASGKHPQRPFVLLAQQSLFDPGRAPDGKQTLWGYCHVPHGSTLDMTERIECQIERFAPGFRHRILERHVMTSADLESYNPNYVGGDINGGLLNLRQFIARPAWRLTPYATPDPRVFLCSASTPPGGGVHGMCGYHAARAALRRKRTHPPKRDQRD